MARIRRTPGVQDKLHEEYGRIVVASPERFRGEWKEVLERDFLHVELGSGKGRFITSLASRYPDTGFIAVEREPEVLYKTARKASRVMPDNLKLLHFDVCRIEEVFGPGEIERIYLNFPDPWPKRRHAKRRMTHQSFIRMYDKVLSPGGEIHFKTDKEGMFEYTIESFSRCGWIIKNVRLDYGEEEAPGDVATEYEEKFREMGQRIFRLEAFREHR